MSDNKYVYKPYSPLFPELFEKEKQRIALALPCSCKIEHVGSTSIEGLGGKGIIDIAIATDHKNLKEITTALQNIGYEFRPSFSTEEMLHHPSVQ